MFLKLFSNVIDVIRSSFNFLTVHFLMSSPDIYNPDSEKVLKPRPLSKVLYHNLNLFVPIQVCYGFRRCR